MSHSPEQMRKKSEARHEAQNHAKHGNVLLPRDGKDHEDHKVNQMSADMADSQQPLGVNQIPGNGGGSY